MLDVEWEDDGDGFVSVNLDSSRCDICNLDTGEDLMPCGICRQEVSNAYTRTGFNELPAHANMQAHKGCLWKDHQTSQLTSRYNPNAPRTPINSNPVKQRLSASSSMFGLMTGGTNSNSSTRKYRSKSQPAIVHEQSIQSPPASPRRLTVGLTSQPITPGNNGNSGSRYSKGTTETNKEAFNSKLQKLIRKAKNKETVENIINDSDLRTRSNPASRSASPIFFKDVDKQKFGSDKDLSTSSVQKDSDTKYMSLKQRYTKYLFGKSLFSKPAFFGKRKQSAPEIIISVKSPPDSTPSNQNSDLKQQRGTDGDLKAAVDRLRNMTVTDGGNVGGDYNRGITQFNNNRGRRRGVSAPNNVELTVITPVMIVDEEPAERAKEDLFKLSSNHLRDKIEAMSSIVKEISNDLVDLLEERDEMRLEVNMRHLMIEKLVAQEKARQALNM